MKKFIALKENRNANFLKIETAYNLGGYNVFTHKSEPRGYYLSVSPVNRYTRDGIGFESYTAFSGVKLLLLEVSRKSKKVEAAAEQIAAEKESELIRYICEKNNLEVLENAQL